MLFNDLGKLEEHGWRDSEKALEIRWRDADELSEPNFLPGGACFNPNATTHTTDTVVYESLKHRNVI